MNTRLKELRELCGITQTELAEELGVSQQVYSRYETGAREPPLEFLCLAADYYNTSTDVLLRRKAMPPVSAEEQELLGLWRRLSPANRTLIMNMLRSAVPDDVQGGAGARGGLWTQDS